MSQRKRARPNPSRRKTAKVRLEGQSVAPGTVLGEKSVNVANGKPVKQQAKPATSGQAAYRKANSQKQNGCIVNQSSALAKRKATSTRQDGPKPQAEESSNGWTGSLALATPAFITGGLVGCVAGGAVLLSAGLWKDFGGVESAILAARTAKLCMDNLCEDIITSLKAGTYSAPEALDMLRRTTLAYAGAIPGGAPFVERMFREVEMVRKQRGREIDKVVAETYTELSKAGKRGAGMAEMHSIIIKSLVKLSAFAGRATQDIVARNPKLRPYRDGVAKSLRPPPEPKVPTVKVNMVVNQKQAVGA